MLHEASDFVGSYELGEEPSGSVEMGNFLTGYQLIRKDSATQSWLVPDHVTGFHIVDCAIIIKEQLSQTLNIALGFTGNADEL